jgi:hypothetical protein
VTLMSAVAYKLKVIGDSAAMSAGQFAVQLR